MDVVVTVDGLTAGVPACKSQAQAGCIVAWSPVSGAMTGQGNGGSGGPWSGTSGGVSSTSRGGRPCASTLSPARPTRRLSRRGCTMGRPMRQGWNGVFAPP
ncbi:MAG: hypothetical protein ACOVKC_10315 [Brevundimonas sp.]